MRIKFPIQTDSHKLTQFNLFLFSFVRYIYPARSARLKSRILEHQLPFFTFEMTTSRKSCSFVHMSSRQFI